MQVNFGQFTATLTTMKNAKTSLCSKKIKISTLLHSYKTEHEH